MAVNLDITQSYVLQSIAEKIKPENAVERVRELIAQMLKG